MLDTCDDTDSLLGSHLATDSHLYLIPSCRIIFFYLSSLSIPSQEISLISLHLSRLEALFSVVLFMLALLGNTEIRLIEIACYDVYSTFVSLDEMRTTVCIEHSFTGLIDSHSSGLMVYTSYQWLPLRRALC